MLPDPARIEWRYARDAPAPEIKPAARTDGSPICVPAGPLPDCKRPLHVQFRRPKISIANLCLHQTDQDTIYEQDLLREVGSIKPWLAYIEFKQQNGTLYEQAFVCYILNTPKPVE